MPKVLSCLNPHPLKRVVTFKLETDESLLEVKVRQAMERYGVHLVVGNLLSRIRSEVQLYLP